MRTLSLVPSLIFSSLSWLCTTSWAQQAPASVVVVGARFPAQFDPATSGASSISAEEIRQAGIDNVNEAVRKLAGVYGRKSSRGTQDFDLDLDGFGVNSANNLVVMIDGVRLSENEQTVALLSSIPIDSVARIEIMPGGSSVLYGDGATGGVIQITTQQTGPSALTGFVIGQAGQFNHRSGRTSLQQGWDNLNLYVNLSDLKSDNFRVNNGVSQQNMSGALIGYFDTGRVGLRLDSVRQRSGFPGPLSLAQFEEDPRQSQTPWDNGSMAIERVSAFIEQNIGDWQLAAQLFVRNRTSRSHFVSLPSSATYTGSQTGFAPRVRHEMDIGKLHNELTVGLDLMRWNRQTTSPFSHDYATQKSAAIYVQNKIKIEQALITFGARREVFDKTSIDPIAGSMNDYNVVQGVNAWELQGSYAINRGLTIFSKAGQSYRVANVDDNAVSGMANRPLLPQLSHDLEVGARWGDVNRQATLRFFRHRLTNEIYFNPLINHGFGANANLDPTERKGAALAVKFRLSPEFQIRAQLQHVNARFTAGDHQGKEIALVPRNAVSAHVNWTRGDRQKAYVGAQWVGAQRYGNDFTNSCFALIPSYVTLDARYSHKMGPWEVSISGSNLTNKPYFTNAFGCRAGIYPDDGRQLKIGFYYTF